MPSKSPSKNPRNDHMAKRKATGMTQKSVAKEFGKHPSTVSRALRKGFVTEGSARD